MSDSVVRLTGEDLSLDTVWQVAHSFRLGISIRVELADSARQKMLASREYIETRMTSGEAIYGVNTGFGAFSSVRISDSEIEQLQRNLIRSHSCGVGAPFSIEETRAIMLLRANALANGLSGIRPLVVDKILEFLNENLIPVIPQQGSVGASGDLAPLSHLALAIIGEGEAWDLSNQGSRGGQGPSIGRSYHSMSNSCSEHFEKVSIQKWLKTKNIEPLDLKAKEGLSLINGCQVMTAVGLLKSYEARRLLWLADVAGAMTLEALQGSRKAFDPLIAAARPHHGEAETARNLLKILGENSSIADSHLNCNRVQDAYSLRCMPAVHGAAKSALRRVVETLTIEANSATDNPLVFSDDEKILSCGNFHGEPIAFALDYLGIAMAAMASMSECRIEKLINPSMSGLPAFLAPKGGLNSGHMIVQVAAAALVSENKILAHPASVDSIPTSADKEDHVSMGTISARKLGQIVRNAENILAMELLSSVQAIDLLLPLEPGPILKSVRDKIREKVPFADEDRVFSTDIEVIRSMIHDDSILQIVLASTGPLEW